MEPYSFWTRIRMILAFSILGDKAIRKPRTLLFSCFPFLYPLFCHAFWQQVSKEAYPNKSQDCVWHQITRNIIAKILETNKFDTLLEVGCGTGDNLVFLKDKFPQAQFTGCDFSERQIEKARQCKTIQFDVADCRNLPYEDKSFDVVLTVGTLVHIPPIHISQCAKELQRITKYVLIIFEEDQLYADTDMMWFQKLMGWHFYHDYETLFEDFDMRFMGNNMPSLKIGLHTHLYTRKVTEPVLELQGE